MPSRPKNQPPNRPPIIPTHQIGSKSEDVIDSAKEKVMNAGTKVADKVSNDTFKIAEKADEIKNKVHNFADNAKK